MPLPPVYSVDIFSGVVSGEVIVGPPPSGFIWIVRDIDCRGVFASPWTAQTGFEISDAIGTMIFQATQCVSQKTYSWRGRQVLEAEDFLRLIGLDSGWSMRISGYQLSLP